MNIENNTVSNSIKYDTLPLPVVNKVKYKGFLFIGDPHIYSKQFLVFSTGNSSILNST